MVKKYIHLDGRTDPVEVDYKGRVWMHCEQGFTLSKASLARFMMYVLTNDIEIGSVHAFNANYKNSTVLASILIKPSQFEEFEKETRGKLRFPPKLSLEME